MSFPPQILCMNRLLSDIMYRLPLVYHSPYALLGVSLINILCSYYDTLSHTYLVPKRAAYTRRYQTIRLGHQNMQ